MRTQSTEGIDGHEWIDASICRDSIVTIVGATFGRWASFIYFFLVPVFLFTMEKSKFKKNIKY